jgi:hypothetical protein
MRMHGSIIRGVVAILLTSSAAAARAEPAVAPARDIESAARAELVARSGMGLMNTLPAALDPEQRVVVLGLGGYDSSQSAGIARLVGDVHLIGPLDLRLGLSYLSEVDVGQHQWESPAW